MKKIKKERKNAYNLYFILKIFRLKALNVRFFFFPQRDLNDQHFFLGFRYRVFIFITVLIHFFIIFSR